MSIWDNITLFGTSRGECIGCTIKNLPDNIKLDYEYINHTLSRRTKKYIGSTERSENDSYKIISGLYNDKTTGEPLVVIFQNKDAEFSENTRQSIPRPSHADYTASLASSNIDLRGGGFYSGRLTAGLVFAGAIAKQYLGLRDIEVLAKIKKIAYIEDENIDPLYPDIDSLLNTQNSDVPMFRETSILQAKKLIEETIYKGDSLSSQIECLIYNYPAAIGGYHFESCESVISQGIFAIPGVKGITFGTDPNSIGFGSKYNDSFLLIDEMVKTKTNNCGGILGGRTNGMPIIFTVDMKPTPSINQKQETINIKEKTLCTIENTGRNDVCIGLRACPVIESVAALWAMYSLKE